MGERERATAGEFDYFEAVRDALRRLNPEFHKLDASWLALDAIETRLTSGRKQREEAAASARDADEAIRSVVYWLQDLEVGHPESETDG